MNIGFNIIEALTSLGANKLRSMLTVLGIVIGVTAVIALLALGQGATASITSQIESIGTNLVFISPGSTRQGGVAQGEGSAQTLTTNDAAALAQLPGVVAVAPVVGGRIQIAYQGQNSNTRMTATDPAYQTMTNLSLASGGFFSDSNESAYSSVVVIGSAVAQQLFNDPAGGVGALVTLNGLPFQVVGVLQSKGGTGFFNQDDQIFVPLSTAQLRLVGQTNLGQGNVVNSIDVQVDQPNDVNNVTQEITQQLSGRHGSVDFNVTSQQDVLSTITQTTNVLTIFLGGIAGISLLVGGIGIMNIMLTTVTERNSRNWPAQGCRSAPLRHSAAVPGGVGGAECDRWCGRSHFWVVDRPPAGSGAAGRFCHHTHCYVEQRFAGNPVFDGGRPVLWDLPGQPGSKIRACGSITDGIKLSMSVFLTCLFCKHRQPQTHFAWRSSQPELT